MIRVHTIFDVKVDGTNKSCVVADGHLFIVELDGMVPCATDIGNSYLEAITSEKVCIRERPEFGALEGHLLIIYKALYGLCLSGNLFGQLLQECLRDLRFKPLFVELTIYMRKCPTADHYKYVATYVDNLCMIMKDLQSLLDQLMAPPYNFKLKGSREIVVHLDCGFTLDITGTLCMDHGKYIDRMEQSYFQYFKTKPVQQHRFPCRKGTT